MDGGVAQRRNHGIAEASRRSSSTGNLMRSGAGVREEELGEGPGPEAERLRWPAVAEVLRNGRTTVAGALLRAKVMAEVVGRV